MTLPLEAVDGAVLARLKLYSTPAEWREVLRLLGLTPQRAARLIQQHRQQLLARREAELREAGLREAGLWHLGAGDG